VYNFILKYLRVNHLYTAFQSIFECTFSSSTSQDLSFEDKVLYIQTFSNFLCLSLRRCNAKVRYWNTCIF